MQSHRNQAVQVGAGAVILKDGKTLLVKRKGSHGEGCYGSFGGHVEFGESPVAAVKREAREELGVEVGNIRFVSCTNMQKYGKHYIDISFTCEIVSGEPKLQEPDKGESLGWYPLDNLPSPLFEPVQIVLDALRSGQIYFELKE